MLSNSLWSLLSHRKPEMSRFVIQSRFTGCFLSVETEGFSVIWTQLLADACVADDLESCAQLINDHCEPCHHAMIVDLDDLNNVQDISL